MVAFFCNSPAPTAIYTLSLHDALPISALQGAEGVINLAGESIAAKRWSQRQKERIRESRIQATRALVEAISDRKSTRLNSSHLGISYAVFCLKKKKKNKPTSLISDTGQ